MHSPRLSGPAEKMGTIRALPNFKEHLPYMQERQIRKALFAAEIGSLSIVKNEVVLPDSKHPAHATFIDRDEFGRGRDEGRHGARFGQMIINGAGLYESPSLIVAKPFTPDSDNDPDELLAVNLPF